jgi:catechol O-methyltransferase
MMFLDHYKPACTTDLKLYESLGMIKNATVFAADNIVMPGNSPYLKYVRSTVQEKRMAVTNQQISLDTESFPSRSAAQCVKNEIFSEQAAWLSFGKIPLIPIVINC